jgi:hypothetical protein
VGALEHRSPVAVEERIYNCYSAVELVAEGLSELPEWRILETGWNGRTAASTNTVRSLPR